MNSRNMRTVIISLILISGLTACKQNNMQLTQKEKAVAFIKSFETGSSKVLDFIDQNIKSHNYGLPDKKSTYEGYFIDEPSGATVGNIRVFEDNDFVVMHNHYENVEGYPERIITFDIVRFKDGKIIEHWDNVMEVLPKNPSGHTQVDGPKEPTDLDKTEINKTIVSDFVSTILVKGEIDKLENYIDPGKENYIQHNPSIADGLSGLEKAFEEMKKQGNSMVYSKTHKILGEGSFVLAISEGTLTGKGTSFYDLFRVANGKIVEHWDIIETIAPKSEWQNANEKFNF